MAVYRFKVSFEDFDCVREIDIKPNQTFMDLHLAIHASIGFDPNFASSFYVSNDFWHKGTEITYLPNERRIAKGIKLMTDAKLSAYIDDPYQRFYYIFNFDKPFDFHVQLSKIIDDLAGTEYPICTKSMGEPPRQFNLPPAIAALILEDEEIGILDLIDEPVQTDEFSIVGLDEEDTPEGQEGEETEAEEENEFGDLGFGDATDEDSTTRDDY